MILIRSLLYLVSLLFSTVVLAGLLSIIGWLLPYRQRCQIANAWGGVNIWFLKLLCNLDYEIDGLEKIPESGAIILAKHQSAWETMALRWLLPPEQAWVLKRELMWVPFFGWAAATVQPIAINRKAGSKAARQVIDIGLERLRQHRLVVIFPEGTRVAPGERKRYGMGGALLAEKSGAPVIPIAHNAGSFWRRRDIRKYPGVIKVVVGDPIHTAGRKAAEINKEVETWIEQTMSRIQ
ncbi:lysophospholipid acyltransferase family protein [Sedimenticola selenatireducens]|uniref:1-acyl-sn-glycerol-3-phosphate acyltransferase n=1 Tax=Sedimenticola selenatireducens TaxID=191960 RepID=A0A2N6CUF0_9GAMM|nr:lysophospholipid acyltransferase family protein [Sedimenticola selenatireducens]PLX60748.1 MAG: 1-acyl-sn-glycerol-3-phosphate acyltransferase [Sedimenticola selenatireducens]